MLLLLVVLTPRVPLIGDPAVAVSHGKLISMCSQFAETDT